MRKREKKVTCLSFHFHFFQFFFSCLSSPSLTPTVCFQHISDSPQPPSNSLSLSLSKLQNLSNQFFLSRLSPRAASPAIRSAIGRDSGSRHCAAREALPQISYSGAALIPTHFSVPTIKLSITERERARERERERERGDPILDEVEWNTGANDYPLWAEFYHRATLNSFRQIGS